MTLAYMRPSQFTFTSSDPPVPTRAGTSFLRPAWGFFSSPTSLSSDRGALTWSGRRAPLLLARLLIVDSGMSSPISDLDLVLLSWMKPDSLGEWIVI